MGTDLTLGVDSPQGSSLVEAKRSHLTGEVRQELATKATEFVSAVLELEVGSRAFEDRVNAILQAGANELRQSASTSGRILRRPAAIMEFGSSGKTITGSLSELRTSVEGLDPSKQKGLLDRSKWHVAIPTMNQPIHMAALTAGVVGGLGMLLFHPILSVAFAALSMGGLIRFGSKLRAYFLRFKSADSHLAAILETLRQGKRTLEEDRAALLEDKDRFTAVNRSLERYDFLFEQIDERLQQALVSIESNDLHNAERLRNELVFYIRERRRTLLEQQGVNSQAVLTYDLIARTNRELIRGVDNAMTVTMTALRIAVASSLALGSERLVLSSIGGLAETTSALIEQTSITLKQQVPKIYGQAAAPSIGIEQLGRAFANVYEAIDSVEGAHSSALGSMQTSITHLKSLIDGAQEHLSRVRKEGSGSQSAPRG